MAGLWSASGGSGHAGVGAATGVTMATTVAIQFAMGVLLRRFGPRPVLAAGSLVLGLPTFAYLLSPAVGWVLAVSAVRGVGFGAVAVAGSALVAELAPPSVRGRAVGQYGVAVGLPQVICLPVGVWCAERFGFTAVFLVTGALPVVSAGLVALMTGSRSGAGPAPDPDPAPGPVGAGGLLRPMIGPMVTMLVAACTLGAAAAFLPLALASPTTAAIALFALSAAVVVGRVGAGAAGDRIGSGRLLVPAVIVSAVGTGGLALGLVSTAPAVVAVLAAAVYGLGFGVLQNDSLVVMFRRDRSRRHALASAGWNMGYDAGTGVGSMAVGALSQPLGFDGAFIVLAVLGVATVPFAWRARAGERSR